MKTLAAAGISKSFGSFPALTSVDLEVRAGEVLALIGENGSGKSTLMTILAGEANADAGKMTLNGQPYQPKNPIEAKQAGVSLIHQELALCPHLSGADNVWLGEATSLVRPKEREARTREVLKDMGFSFIPVHVPVGRLPIAQRQALEIARAWASKADVCLFDEPTSSLSREEAEKLFGLIDRMKGMGKGIVYISHFLEETRKIADKTVILRDGEGVFHGAMDAISDSEIIRQMVGREVSDLYPRSARTRGEVLVEGVRLTGDHQRPQSATFTLHRGEVVGIAGLSGAGRTELLRTIFGLRGKASGELRTCGFSSGMTPHEAWASKAGFVSEDRKGEGVALGLSVADNVTMASLPKGVLSPKSLFETAAKEVESLRIKCRSPRQTIRQLSGGNQQKAALARLSAAGAELCLLDEPTRGIDVGSKAEIYQLIDQWACQGKCIVMAGSHLPELIGICDRILVMNRGRLVGELAGSEATQQALLELCLKS